jgi:hypothetical protein
MTEHDDDPETLRRISRRYRGLGAEEPPRALDDAILAAARREAGARPGSPGRAAPQRWYAPLAAAAVLVLAVAVTLHMQTEQPDIAQPAPAAKRDAAPSAPVPAAAPRDAPAKSPTAPQPQSVAKERSEAVTREANPASAEIAASSPPSEPVPFPARADRAVASSAAPQAAAPARAQSLEKRAAAQANVQAESPERELERIAELRRQARHEEADKALADFRKRYPEFSIPEEMRARVERR